MKEDLIGNFKKDYVYAATSRKEKHSAQKMEISAKTNVSADCFRIIPQRLKSTGLLNSFLYSASALGGATPFAKISKNVDFLACN